MLISCEAAQWFSRAKAVIGFGFSGFILFIHAQNTSVVTNLIEVVAIEGTAEIARAGQKVWDLASARRPYSRLNPGDQIRTKDHSRATIRLSDLTIVELGPNAHLEMLPARQRGPGLAILRGLLYLFHRDK